MPFLRLPRPTRRPHHATAPTSQPRPPDDEAPGACGWFDSSHDLQQGLSVRELREPAALARELPLPFWLDLQGAACTTTHPAARP